MSFLAAIGGIVSSFVSVVGPVISTAADFLINKLPPMIETAKIVITTISVVISKVCETLGIGPADENIEELGAKVMQEDTRPKMEEETTQEYLDYLRNEVQLDNEKFNELSPEDRIACGVLGTSMKAKCIEEKTGVELPPDFLLTIAKSKMRYEQVAEFINAFAENGIDSMGKFTKYISNNMSEAEAIKVGTVVKETISKLDPDMTNDDIQNEIISMKRSYQTSNF